MAVPSSDSRDLHDVVGSLVHASHPDSDEGGALLYIGAGPEGLGDD